MSSENHPCWKGEKAKYSAIHVWVVKHKGVASVCSFCGVTSEKTRIEWSNKDHKYRRNLEDYVALCVDCHYVYDKENGLNNYRPKQDKKTGKFISSS